MKIKNITRTIIKALASPDSLKPALHGVLIAPDKKRAVVTNGHALIMYPLEIEDGEEVSRAVVPVDIFAPNIKQSESAEYCINGAAVRQDSAGSQEADLIPDKFPDYEEVIKPDGQAYTITLDFNLLAKVAKAIPGGANEQKPVRLHITGPITAVKFETTDKYKGDAIKGLIMPIRDDQSGRAIYGKDENGNVQEWKEENKTKGGYLEKIR